MRHIEVNQLWLQDKVYSAEVILNKAKSDEHIADALTKVVVAETLGCHMDNNSGECRRDRHWMAPEVTEEHAAEDRDREEGSEQEQWLESVATTERY